MIPENSHHPTLQAHIKRLWLHGFLAGFVVVLIIVSIMFFIWGWPSSGPDVAEESKPNISQAPAAPAARAPGSEAAPPAAAAQQPANLKADLETVLARLAEANQKKDQRLLLSLYDPAFPDLRRKTEEISRTWATYDYLNLRFRIEEIKSPSPDEAVARIIWEAQTQNRSTQQIKDLTRTYLVRFSNGSGQWRIKSLEKAGNPGEQGKS